MIILNTFYKLPPRRLYTWKSPMDSCDRIVRNQIDYIHYKNIIETTGQKHLKPDKNIKKKPWMTDKILDGEKKFRKTKIASMFTKGSRKQQVDSRNDP